MCLYTALRAVLPSCLGQKRRGFEVATYETLRLMMTPLCASVSASITRARKHRSAPVRALADAHVHGLCEYALIRVIVYDICWKDGQHDATIEQLDAGDPGPNSPTPVWVE